MADPTPKKGGGEEPEKTRTDISPIEQNQNRVFPIPVTTVAQEKEDGLEEQEEQEKQITKERFVNGHAHVSTDVWGLWGQKPINDRVSSKRERECVCKRERVCVCV